MKYLFYPVIFILFSCQISCNQQSESKKVSSDMAEDTKQEKVNRSMELIPEPDILDRLKWQKAMIDSSMSEVKLDLEILVKEPDTEGLTKVVDDEWPEEFSVTYHLWANANGQIEMIGEYPFSESGDWGIGYLHYFDKNGKTFSFERNTNFYNSECADDLVNEDILEFYDNDFNRISRTYDLTGPGGQNLNDKNCSLPYDYPYDVAPSLENYLNRINYKR